MPPRPKPTALRLLQGARPRDTNQHEPVAPSLLPVCPDDEPDEVQEVFAETVRSLLQMGLASSADTDQLVAYSWAVVNHRTASRLVRQTPILVRNGAGSLVVNPALKAQRDAALLMRAYAHEFGLTPSARAGLEVRGGGEDDDNPYAGNS